MYKNVHKRQQSLLKFDKNGVLRNTRWATTFQCPRARDIGVIFSGCLIDEKSSNS